MASIFDHRDYKVFLKSKSAEHGLRSGFKSGLAKACGCNNAYISSVLGGKAHLSLEQAERAAGHLHFSPNETHFLLLLVQHARSGTLSLRRYFAGQIELILDDKLNVQRRLGAKDKLSAPNQARYYSSWIYGALHVAVSVPRLACSTKVLADYFNLPPATVRDALDFLIGCGLVTENERGYAIGPRHIHLGRNSEYINRHHTNWRMMVLRSFESDTQQNFNYSSVVTLSREDAFKVREILLSAVKQSSDLILQSPEEEVYAMAADFVKLGRD